MTYPNLIDKGLPQARALLNALGNGPELEAVVQQLLGDSLPLAERAALVREEQAQAPLLPKLAGELVSQGAASTVLGGAKVSQPLVQGALGAFIGSQGGTDPEGLMLGAALGGGLAQMSSPEGRKLVADALRDEAGTLQLSQLLEGRTIKPGATETATRLLTKGAPVEAVTQETGVIPLLGSSTARDSYGDPVVRYVTPAPVETEPMYNWLEDVSRQQEAATTLLLRSSVAQNAPSAGIWNVPELAVTRPLNQIVNESRLLAAVQPNMQIAVVPELRTKQHLLDRGVFQHGDVVHFAPGTYTPGRNPKVQVTAPLTRVDTTETLPAASAQIKTNLETLLHELTHNAQTRLELTPGSSPSRQLPALYKQLLEPVFEANGVAYPINADDALTSRQFQMYSHNQGEQFARTLPKYLLQGNTPTEFWDVFRKATGQDPAQSLVQSGHGAHADAVYQGLWLPMWKGQ